MKCQGHFSLQFESTDSEKVITLAPGTIREGAYTGSSGTSQKEVSYLAFPSDSSQSCKSYLQSDLPMASWQSHWSLWSCLGSLRLKGISWWHSQLYSWLSIVILNCVSFSPARHLHQDTVLWVLSHCARPWYCMVKRPSWALCYLNWDQEGDDLVRRHVLGPSLASPLVWSQPLCQTAQYMPGTQAELLRLNHYFNYTCLSNLATLFILSVAPFGS